MAKTNDTFRRQKINKKPAFEANQLLTVCQNRMKPSVLILTDFFLAKKISKMKFIQFGFIEFKQTPNLAACFGV